LTAAAAAQAKYPPITDVIGRWEDAGNKANWFDFSSDPATPLVSQETLTVTGAKGQPWTVDTLIPYSVQGSVWLSRFPRADEMPKGPDSPQWARKQAEDELRWELRLRAEKGEQGPLGDLLSDNRCELTLKGTFYPGRVDVKGPRRDANTREILEDGATLKILIGTDAPGQAKEFKKVWYDPPAMDQSVTFAWSNPDAARSKLGYAAGDAMVAELNQAATEAAAYAYYRSFVGSIFKAGTYAATLVGVGGVVQIGAEGLMGEFAQNVVENVVGKAIAGDPIGRETFVQAAAATASSALVGRLVSVDPGFAETFSTKLSEELGERLAGPVADLVKAKTPPTPGQQTAAATLSNEDARRFLEEKFTEQCRFHILPVKLARGISGILVADRALHTAEIVLYVPASNGKPSAVVRGSFGYITSEGRPPVNQSIFLDVLGGAR
jgi:hypothetical protein